MKPEHGAWKLTGVETQVRVHQRAGRSAFAW
jgi:hypothetical protein